MLNIDGRLLEKLDANEYYLFSVLLNYGKKSRPKNSVLCRKTRWGIEKVQKVKKSLENKGVLKIESRKNKERGGKDSNCYKLITPLASKYNGSQVHETQIFEIQIHENQTLEFQLDDFQIVENQTDYKVLKVSIIESIELLKVKNKDIVPSKEETSLLPFELEVLDLLDHFKKESGKDLKIPTTKTGLKNYAHYKSLKARLNKGAEVDDIKKVLSYCCEHWTKDTYMFKYRRISTIVGAKYDEYYEEMINYKPIEEQTNEPTYPTIEAYIQAESDPKVIKGFKQSGQLETFQAQYDENKFKLCNIAKGFQNPNLHSFFIFECMYMPFGRSLSGSKPDRKLDSLKDLLKKQNDYTQKYGNIREVVQKYAKKKVL